MVTDASKGFVDPDALAHPGRQIDARSTGLCDRCVGGGLLCAAANKKQS
jgi:hypothetical protein